MTGCAPRYRLACVEGGPDLSLTVGVDANAGRLAKALGLIDADGGLVPGWFEHPLEHVRRALSDETQRAALLELLQDLLPPDDAAPDDAGARWHPLLERDGPGNVYLTVEGDVIGVAAAIATDGAEPPLARAGIRLPLVQAGEDDLRAVAGTADGPLEMVLDAEWGAGEHPSAIRVRAGVDLESGARLLLILEDLEVGGVTIPSATIDPAELDADAVRALEALIASLLAGVSTGEPRVNRVIAHLPGLLGLDPRCRPCRSTRSRAAPARCATGSRRSSATPPPSAPGSRTSPASSAPTSPPTRPP